MRELYFIPYCTLSLIAFALSIPPASYSEFRNIVTLKLQYIVTVFRQRAYFTFHMSVFRLTPFQKMPSQSGTLAQTLGPTFPQGSPNGIQRLRQLEAELQISLHPDVFDYAAVSALDTKKKKLVRSCIDNSVTRVWPIGKMALLVNATGQMESRDKRFQCVDQGLKMQLCEMHGVTAEKIKGNFTGPCDGLHSQYIGKYSSVTGRQHLGDIIESVSF